MDKHNRNLSVYSALKVNIRNSLKLLDQRAKINRKLKVKGIDPQTKKQLLREREDLTEKLKNLANEGLEIFYHLRNM